MAVVVKTPVPYAVVLGSNTGWVGFGYTQLFDPFGVDIKLTWEVNEGFIFELTAWHKQSFGLAPQTRYVEGYPLLGQ